MRPQFRPLKADEIECRIGTVSRSGNGITVLLYKNARVDMNLLDEVVGPENWQREHYECKGNMYCRVGLYLNEQWVWKSDCGTESNTEKEKGESSDSFKRACVNWGIGRALYSAPFIWLNYDKDSYQKAGIHVSNIEYDQEGKEITKLELQDKDGKTVFNHKTRRKATQATQAVSAPERAEQQAQATVTRVTLDMYKKGRCKSIISHLASMYDAVTDSISPEALQDIKGKYQWDGDAIEAVVDAAKKEGFKNDLHNN